MDFLQECLVEPFLKDQGYNLCNSALLFTTLALILVFVIPPMLKKLNVKFDSRFIKGLIAYAILGAILRSFEDVVSPQTPLLVSPSIWILGILVGLGGLLLSKYLEKLTKIGYHKIWTSIAVVINIVLLVQFPWPHLSRLGILLLIILPWAIPLYFLSKFNVWNLNKKLISLPIAAHLLDASATFTSIQFFGYFEKHVLPNFLIERFGPIVMFPLKILVIGAIVVYIYREFPDQRRYYLTIIGLFGLVTSVRDIVTLLNL